ncbi:Uncharacterized conserved protein YndB, AHSA1/START domain [Pedococcus cremeus]|uniref:Uncharacterized conserved protein YndB, AHSA1/START domain n=1 Tax=Pedococcus cremeus TaxID=587636 RepID=A0A1H9WJM2_9MICO|nr:SRPBCC family protein [Pedococcus cremeus]SES34075.1 Uncharacterized conserved protein YndB, AHSA1/START domain [Pedococcus cremeus]
MNLNEPLTQLGMVDREVATRTVDGREAKATVLRQTYDAPIDDVWAACTTADRIGRWLTPVSGDLRLGGRYQLQGNAGGVVETCEPPHLLGVTWEYGGDVTWVEVRLSPAEHGGTHFELRHIAHVDEERWAEFGPGAVGIGWDMALFGLSLHLSGNEMSGPEEAAAWTASDDGRLFMGTSGERWHDAHLATGEDPEKVRACADRTIAAYTAQPPARDGNAGGAAGAGAERA